MLQRALAAAATLIALASTLAMWERARGPRKIHELVWTVALSLFTIASAALWWGASMGWSATSFRAFYLFGAIVNVPVLALGSYALAASPNATRRAVIAVGALSAFATGVMAEAPIGAINPQVLPRGSEVLTVLPRVLAATCSGVATLVLLWLCVVGAIRTTGSRRIGNILIAVGTLTTAASGLLNSALGAMSAFATVLAVGIALIFAGFLAATGQPRVAANPQQESTA